jgi:hypothetical protein
MKIIYFIKKKHVNEVISGVLPWVVFCSAIQL